MMREGDQVNGGGFRFDLDVWIFFKSSDQTVHDRATCGVADVKDAATRVSSFLSPNGCAVVGVIKDNACGTFQYFVQQLRAFISQNTRGFRRAYTCSGSNDVFIQQLGRVVRTTTDDATLC